METRANSCALWSPHEQRGAPPGLERWERRYAAEEYVFGTAPSGFLAKQAHLLHPGMTALALADGEGRNGVWLAEQGLDVLAVDFSPTGQAKARALAAERGVTLRTECADLAQWGSPRRRSTWWWRSSSSSPGQCCGRISSTAFAGR